MSNVIHSMRAYICSSFSLGCSDFMFNFSLQAGRWGPLKHFFLQFPLCEMLFFILCFFLFPGEFADGHQVRKKDM